MSYFRPAWLAVIIGEKSENCACLTHAILGFTKDLEKDMVVSNGKMSVALVYAQEWAAQSPDPRVQGMLPRVSSSNEEFQALLAKTVQVRALSERIDVGLTFCKLGIPLYPEGVTLLGFAEQFAWHVTELAHLMEKTVAEGQTLLFEMRQLHRKIRVRIFCGILTGFYN